MDIKGIIKNHKRIMIDTAPIVYFIEEHGEFGEIADEIFKMINDDSSYHSFSSVITITEVLTQPLRKSRRDLYEKYKKFLLNSSNFFVYSIDPIVAEKAAELRAQFGIKTPDALQLAVGIENNGSLFITNDNVLKKVNGIEVLVLKDYLPGKGFPTS
jgi:predicted nucleic acid-binding protein